MGRGKTISVAAPSALERTVTRSWVGATIARPFGTRCLHGTVAVASCREQLLANQVRKARPPAGTVIDVVEDTDQGPSRQE